MPAPSPDRYDVFVSYKWVEPDMSWVRTQLAPALRNAGLSVLIDVEGFTPGLDSFHEMERGLRDSDHTLCILSPDYLSGHAGFEALVARHKDPMGLHSILVPLILRSVEMPAWLESLVSINWVDPDSREREWRKLLKVLQAPHVDSPLPGSPSSLPEPPTGTLGRVRKPPTAARKPILLLVITSLLFLLIATILRTPILPPATPPPPTHTQVLSPTPATAPQPTPTIRNTPTMPPTTPSPSPLVRPSAQRIDQFDNDCIDFDTWSRIPGHINQRYSPRCLIPLTNEGQLSMVEADGSLIFGSTFSWQDGLTINQPAGCTLASVSLTLKSFSAAALAYVGLVVDHPSRDGFISLWAFQNEETAVQPTIIHTNTQSPISEGALASPLVAALPPSTEVVLAVGFSNGQAFSTARINDETYAHTEVAIGYPENFSVTYYSSQDANLLALVDSVAFSWTPANCDTP